MKKAGWIATVAAGVVLVGGGAWGATMLAVSDEGSTTATAVTPTPEPIVTPEVTPTPSVEPTPTPTPTPTPEVVETPAPVVTEEPAPEPEPEPVEPAPLTEDQIFLQWANEWFTHYGKTMDDAEMLAALDRACYLVANNIDELVIPPELDNEYGDINMIFAGAARHGYFTEGNVPASYCD